MTDSRILFALIPAIFALFALVLAIIAVIDRRLPAARWGSVAFALAAVGVVLDTLRPPGHSWSLFYLHMAVLAAFAKALAARHRDVLPRGFVYSVIGTALLCAFLREIEASLQARQLAFNVGLLAAMALLARRCWSWGHRTRIDRFIVLTVAAIGLTYALKIAILLADPLSDRLSSSGNFFAIHANLVFHFIMGVSGLMAGVLLLVVLGLDTMMAQTNRLMNDELTRVGNRHALSATLAEIETRQWYCSAAIVIDLDYFKTVNDTYGHLAGDALLATVAAVTTRAVGGNGRVFRLGGEEFLVLVGISEVPPGTLAETIRLEIAERATHWRGRTIRATASVGWHRLTSAETIETAIDLADRATYVAKASGRNRSVEYRADDDGGPILAVVA